MKKTLFFAALTAGCIALSGCSSPPAPEPEVPLPLFEELQVLSSKIIESGGLAVVGIAESKSLEIAINKAKTNGRIGLADLLAVKIETLRDDFIEETGLDKNDPLLAPFDEAAQSITVEKIQGLVATRLNYETLDGTVTAYALMEIGPQLILDRLTDEKKLSELFLNSQTYETLAQEIKAHEALPEK